MHSTNDGLLWSKMFAVHLETPTMTLSVSYLPVTLCVTKGALSAVPYQRPDELQNVTYVNFLWNDAGSGSRPMKLRGPRGGQGSLRGGGSADVQNTPMWMYLLCTIMAHALSRRSTLTQAPSPSAVTK